MSRLTKQLKENRTKLVKAANELAGVSGREADCSFAMARATEIDAQLKVAKREQIKVREPALYRENGPYSILMDSLVTSTNLMSPLLPNRWEAMARLQQYAQTDALRQQEKYIRKCERAQSDYGVRAMQDASPISLRDVTTLTNGSAFSPPAFLLSQFSEAIRANSVAQSITKTLPLPPAVDQVLVPGIFFSQNANAIQGEDEDVIPGGIQETGYASIVGCRQYATVVPISIQLLERGGSFLESVLVADGAAGLAEAIDIDIIQGSGLPEAVIPGVAGTVQGEILGVEATSGVLNLTYTDSTPTYSKQISSTSDLLGWLSAQRRRPAQHLLMSPAMYQSWAGGQDTTGALLQPLGIGSGTVKHSADPLGFFAGVPVYGCYGCTGVGTDNEYEYIVAGRFESDALLLVSQPAFNFIEDAQGYANSLTVLMAVRQYVCYCTRIPQGFVMLSGTGVKVV
jgi:hypothetical protein